MRTMLKFAASVIPKSVNFYDRIDEVSELKKALSKMLFDSGYSFAIVGEAVTSNEISSLSAIDFIISVVSNSNTLVEQIHEDLDLQKKIAKACSVNDHHCVVAGEDMMSDHALRKVYGLPVKKESEADE